MKVYIKRPCRICGKVVVANGFAMAAHMKKHVNSGEMIKYQMHGQTLYYKKGLSSDTASSVSWYF